MTSFVSALWFILALLCAIKAFTCWPTTHTYLVHYVYQGNVGSVNVTFEGRLDKERVQQIKEHLKSEYSVDGELAILSLTKLDQ